MKTIKYLSTTAIVIALVFNMVQARFPINIIWPYDLELQWRPLPPCSWDIKMQGEFAGVINGYDNNGHKTNELQLWDPTVSSLAMVRGFAATSAIGQVAAQLNGVTDDGVRGHMVPNGTLQAWDASLSVRYSFPYNLSLGICLPWYSMSLSQISWTDLTKDVTVGDQLVKTLLTDNFVENVAVLSASFGCVGENGLNIGSSWMRAGWGDATLMLAWSRDFPQVKPILRNVNPSVRLGLTLPTGMRSDENIVLPIPFGNDGALGVLLGLGLELQWWNCVRGGVQADFWKVFGDKRERRIKSDAAQDDLVLLARVATYKEWGVARRYTLYGEVGDICRGYMLGFAYQYFNTGDDILSVVDNDFATKTAETARNLEHWKIHNWMVYISVNSGGNNISKYYPRLMVYYKNPFNGTRSLAAKTFGLVASIDF